MANEDEVLPPPIEIPWRLASTTLPFNTTGPDQTSISLFTFVPDEEALTTAFPDETLVFIKVTTSIAPGALPAGVPAGALGEGIPVYHTLLDLAVHLEGGETGTIRPYFHAAAPMKRRMIQSGVVGHEVFEGEASGQFMGKSGSEMHEALNSESRTTSLGASLGVGVGIGPVSIGASGSVRTTSTDLTSSRAVTQNVDTTTREASDERRELVSHSTKVENILTLLNAKYVGTPFLSFSINPRPLHLLSLDPADPNLWFSQLLSRRSSGIEGVQEYTAVIVVPKGKDFCVEARLRRVCLLDAPPGPLTFDERYSSTTSQLVRMLNYVERAFPPGTPLEELDVEVLPALSPADFPRPVIQFWEVAGMGGFLAVLIFAVSPRPGAVITEVETADVVYKHPLELWLDVLRDEYERDVARSPLERGVLLSDTRTLDTCFAFVDGALTVSNSQASLAPFAPLGLNPADVDVGGVRDGALDATRDVRAKGIEVVTRWNALERQLATILDNRRAFPPPKPDRRVADVLIERWAKLAPRDPDNLALEAAAASLGLSDEHVRLLKSAGAADLRSAAHALRSATPAERYNAALEHRTPSGAAAAKPLATAVTSTLSSAQADEIRMAIAKVVEERLGGAR
jgi:hypothetical protein